MKAEKRQISRCWHPAPVTHVAIGDANVTVMAGPAAYQLTDGTIVSL